MAFCSTLIAAFDCNFRLLMHYWDVGEHCDAAHALWFCDAVSGTAFCTRPGCNIIMHPLAGFLKTGNNSCACTFQVVGSTTQHHTNDHLHHILQTLADRPLILYRCLHVVLVRAACGSSIPHHQLLLSTWSPSEPISMLTYWQRLSLFCQGSMRSNIQMTTVRKNASRVRTRVTLDPVASKAGCLCQQHC